MAKQKQPKGFEPGIYFGMPEDAYHADAAFSHSGHVDILVSPPDYWEKSPLNPSRRFKETDATLFGKRNHMALLEPERFKRSYAPTGGGAKWNGQTQLLNRGDWDNIMESLALLKEVPEVFNYFTSGYAEVSIFWRDPTTGLMMRARPDYLRTFGWIDYKRPRSLQHPTLGYWIKEYGVDLQEVHYLDGIRAIRQLLRQGKAKVHGEVDAKWLKAFADDNREMCRLVLQRSVKPYIFEVRRFDPEIQKNARILVDEARQIYKQYIETYGRNRWPAGTAEVKEFSIYHMPRQSIERGVT